MTDKKRLEEIREAIANELGLTDNWMDGTYLYYLTRAKSAFSVGTMTLDDFEEVDEELLESIFDAIEPFFIEQAERVQELERKIERYREAIEVAIHNMATSDNLGVKFALGILEQTLEESE